MAWEAQEGSQQLFSECPIPEILYAGTRGPGKTDALLMKFAQYCERGYGSYWRGVLFRQTYKQLDEIVVKAARWFNQFYPGRAWFVGGDQMMWKWHTGETLSLRHFANQGNYWDYHGHEYPWIAWEELTSWPDNTCYDIMKACWRSSYQTPEGIEPMPRFYLATTNPYGRGHNWVKRYYIDPAPAGTIIHGDGGPRVHIHGSIYENKRLMQADPAYYKSLLAITDPNRRAAWLEGSWDITSGGLFDDIWSSDVHVVEPFAIPDDWLIERAFDWGSSKPFSVGWWARATGSPCTMADGSERHFARGSYLRIAEWYGWNGEPNKGLRMTAAAVAEGIKQRERNMHLIGRVQPGPADSSIFDIEDGKSIAAEFEFAQVRWIRAHKSAGSRKQGWERIRQLLENALAGPEEEGLFVFSTCTQFVRTVPTMPRDDRDPDDADSDAEDHIGDETRYEVLRKPLPPAVGGSMF